MVVNHCNEHDQAAGLCKGCCVNVRGYINSFPLLSVIPKINHCDHRELHHRRLSSNRRRISLRVIPVQSRPTVDFGISKISLTSAWLRPSFLSSWIAFHFRRCHGLRMRLLLGLRRNMAFTSSIPSNSSMANRRIFLAVDRSTACLEGRIKERFRRRLGSDSA